MYLYTHVLIKISTVYCSRTFDMRVEGGTAQKAGLNTFIESFVHVRRGTI